VSLSIVMSVSIVICHCPIDSGKVIVLLGLVNCFTDYLPARNHTAYV